MVLLRSVLVGIGASLVSVILVLLGGIVAVAVIPRPEGISITLDPISAVKTSPLLWILGMVTFCLGFFSEYRRGKLRKSR